MQEMSQLRKEVELRRLNRDVCDELGIGYDVVNSATTHFLKTMSVGLCDMEYDNVLIKGRILFKPSISRLQKYLRRLLGSIRRYNTNFVRNRFGNVWSYYDRVRVLRNRRKDIVKGNKNNYINECKKRYESIRVGK